jgi:anti-sigma-K factor RskA
MTLADLSRDRLHDLLADEAAGELETADRGELEALLSHAPPANRDEFLEIAGLVQLGLMKRDVAGFQRMPSRLESRLMERAATWNRPNPSKVFDLSAARDKRVGGLTQSLAARKRTERNWAAISGWAAAAALAIAFVVTGGPGLAPSAVPKTLSLTLAEERAALIRSEPNLLAVAWKGSPETTYAGVTGDVVWSDRRQQGYLRVTGLPANDPSRAQYQLWIVAPDRDTHPVDGGVFDVGSAGETVIPIHAKLGVRTPKAFAITLEQAGGVVVSKGPMLAVAAAAA